jgi:hypothetical protein
MPSDLSMTIPQNEDTFFQTLKILGNAVFYTGRSYKGSSGKFVELISYYQGNNINDSRLKSSIIAEGKDLCRRKKDIFQKYARTG